MRHGILFYSLLGLIALGSLGGVSAYSLFQNLCFPLANGTPCINWTGSQYEWTNISVAGDGNNYPNTLTVNQTNGNYTIQLARSGLSTLVANFTVNTTTSTGGGGISRVDLYNGTGINVTGNGTNYTIGVANLQACNAASEYSVWNGSHWLCDNDGSGTTYTFSNTDGLVNLSGSPSLVINLNLTAMDLRYTLRSVYDAFVTAIFTNVTTLQTFDNAIYTNVTALQARQTGNTTGTGIANYVARWTNGTNIGTGSITDTGSTVTINSTINLITPTNSNYESLVIFSNETSGGSNNGKIRFEGYGVNGYNKIEFNPEEATSPGSTKVLFNVHNKNWIDNATHQHFSIYTTNTTDSLVKRFDLEYNQTTSDADFSNSNLNLYDGNFAVVEGNASIGAINPALNQRLYIYEPTAGAVAMRIDRGSPNYVSFVTPSGSPSAMEVRVSSTDTPSYYMYVSDGGDYRKGDIRFAQNLYVNKNASINGSANISTVTYTPQLCLSGDCRTSWPSSGSSGGWTNTSTQTTTELRVGINTTSPNSTLHVIGNASIESSLNAANLVLTNTNAGRTVGLRIYRPAAGGLFFTTAGGTPASSQIGIETSGLVQAMPINLYSGTSGNYVHGDVTIGSNGATNQPTSYFSFTTQKTGFNTSAPNATIHVLGTANITQIHSEQICLNSDCRTVWPAAGGGSGGNMSQFVVSDGTTATTVYNNTQVTFTAGSNMVITNNGGNFTFAASVSGGSGNVSGNGTSGYVPLWNGASTQNNSRVFQNSTAINIEKGDFLVNGYSEDRTSLNYFYPQHTEFCDNTVNNGGSGGAFVAGAVSSGVISFTSSSIGQANHPCIVSILDSTTSGGGAFYSAGPNSGVRLKGGENTTVIFRTTVSAGKTNITHRFGFLDSATTAEPTDGAYMQFNISYPNSAAGNVLYAMTTNNSVRTSSAVNTTYSFANNTWYIANVALSLDGTIAYFKLYNETGNLLWNTSIGSNIPRISGRETSQKWISMQSTTDSSSTIADLDYMDFKILQPVRSVVLNG